MIQPTLTFASGNAKCNQNIILMKSIEEAISDVFLWLTTAKNAYSSSGMKYHLMGIAEDIVGLAQRLHDEVLGRAKQDVVLDIGIDFAALSQRLLTMELAEYTLSEVQEQQLQVTEALGRLNAVVEEITAQLERHHRDEEFVRLYEKEKNSYLASGAARYSRKTFEEWKDNNCNGEPTLEDIEDYRLEKLLQMFETGVLDGTVEHIVRVRRYPGEIDFEQVEPNPKITKSPVHHYAALRRLADYEDGCLRVNPLHVGKYFYANRKEENAKANRTNFLKYMHKVELAQQERRKLMQERITDSNGLCRGEAEERDLFHFIHPEIEEEEARRIHKAIKRLVVNQKVQDICIYLKEQREKGKLLLPQSPGTAYKELQRMGMPCGEGYSEKYFYSCYLK